VRRTACQMPLSQPSSSLFERRPLCGFVAGAFDAIEGNEARMGHPELAAPSVEPPVPEANGVKGPRQKPQPEIVEATE
jgi:hypothetical protein